MPTGAPVLYRWAGDLDTGTWLFYLRVTLWLSQPPPRLHLQHSNLLEEKATSAAGYATRLLSLAFAVTTSTLAG